MQLTKMQTLFLAIGAVGLILVIGGYGTSSIPDFSPTTSIIMIVFGSVVAVAGVIVFCVIRMKAAYKRSRQARRWQQKAQTFPEESQRTSGPEARGSAPWIRSQDFRKWIRDTGGDTTTSTMPPFRQRPRVKGIWPASNRSLRQVREKQETLW